MDASAASALAIPGSVLVGGGILWGIVKTAVTGYHAAQREFRTAEQCEAKHHALDDALRRMNEDLTARHTAIKELRTVVQPLRLEVNALQIDLDWMKSAVHSIAKTVGANGFSDPPAPRRRRLAEPPTDGE